MRCDPDLHWPSDTFWPQHVTFSLCFDSLINYPVLWFMSKQYVKIIDNRWSSKKNPKKTFPANVWDLHWDISPCLSVFFFSFSLSFFLLKEVAVTVTVNFPVLRLDFYWNCLVQRQQCWRYDKKTQHRYTKLYKWASFHAGFIQTLHLSFIMRPVCWYITSDRWQIKGKPTGFPRLAWFEPSCPFRQRSHCKSIKMFFQLYPLMKHFYPNGSGLFRDDSAPIHSARGLTEWFHEQKNDTAFTPTQPLWKISNHYEHKTPIGIFVLNRNVVFGFTTEIQFQRFVVLILLITESVLAIAHVTICHLSNSQTFRSYFTLICPLFQESSSFSPLKTVNFSQIKIPCKTIPMETQWWEKHLGDHQLFFQLRFSWVAITERGSRDSTLTFDPRGWPQWAVVTKINTP